MTDSGGAIEVLLVDEEGRYKSVGFVPKIMAPIVAMKLIDVMYRDSTIDELLADLQSDDQFRVVSSKNYWEVDWVSVKRIINQIQSMCSELYWESMNLPG